mmetsp:Transcript_68057/g.221612  ORF Transcript_68057/g.221612 Transcript_68057/m.221612 type:complete len:254 (-) Transcript_68057:483-1244(-)
MKKLHDGVPAKVHEQFLARREIRHPRHGRALGERREEVDGHDDNGYHQHLHEAPVTPRADIPHPPLGQPRVHRIKQRPKQPTADAHQSKDRQLHERVSPDRESAELHGDLGAKRSPRRLAVHRAGKRPHGQGSHGGADKGANQDARVHVRGTLLDREEHTADRSAKRRGNTGSSPGGDEISGFGGQPVRANDRTGVGELDLCRHNRAAMDHGPLLATRQAGADAADNAQRLTDQRPQAEDVRKVDPVQDALDL